MADNTGKPYEYLTQVIFQWIVNQSEVPNIVVQQDVKLVGKARNSHQVDVYWRFALDRLEYETIVETKDWKDPVDQGELLRFKSVLEDLPGQPKGIFVSRGGYQQGAREYARTHGILLYELRETDYGPPVSIPVTGWARYGVIRMPLHGVLHKTDKSVSGDIGVLGFVWDIFAPEFSEVRFEPSTSWLQEEYPAINYGYTLREISTKRRERLDNTRHHFYRGLACLRTFLQPANSASESQTVHPPCGPTLVTVVSRPVRHPLTPNHWSRDHGNQIACRGPFGEQRR